MPLSLQCKVHGVDTFGVCIDPWLKASVQRLKASKTEWRNSQAAVVFQKNCVVKQLFKPLPKTTKFVNNLKSNIELPITNKTLPQPFNIWRSKSISIDSGIERICFFVLKRKYYASIGICSRILKEGATLSTTNTCSGHLTLKPCYGSLVSGRLSCGGVMGSGWSPLMWCDLMWCGYHIRNR